MHLRIHPTVLTPRTPLAQRLSMKTRMTKLLLAVIGSVMLAATAQAAPLPKQLYGTWCLVPGNYSRDGYVRENCVYEKNGEIIVRGGVRKGSPDPNATFSYGADMRQGATDLQAVEIGPKFFGLIEYAGHEPAARTRCKELPTQSGAYGDCLAKMYWQGAVGPLV